MSGIFYFNRFKRANLLSRNESDYLIYSQCELSMSEQSKSYLTEPRDPWCRQMRKRIVKTYIIYPMKGVHYSLIWWSWRIWLQPCIVPLEEKMWKNIYETFSVAFWLRLFNSILPVSNQLIPRCNKKLLYSTAAEQRYCNAIKSR